MSSLINPTMLSINAFSKDVGMIAVRGIQAHFKHANVITGIGEVVTSMPSLLNLAMRPQ